MKRLENNLKTLRHLNIESLQSYLIHRLLQSTLTEAVVHKVITLVHEVEHTHILSEPIFLRISLWVTVE